MSLSDQLAYLISQQDKKNTLLHEIQLWRYYFSWILLLQLRVFFKTWLRLDLFDPSGVKSYLEELSIR